MKVAIEGCCHGCLNQIYGSLLSKNVELLIICGDFQSIRNQADLSCMSVPDKFKKIGDFQDYYSGKKKAPIFTIFIGGNHEASNYLEELKFGGFVAQNIFYLGRSSVIWYKGLRIGGWSGIYKSNDFLKSRQEYRLPFDNRSLRSVYHYRKDDYLKLRLLKECNKMIFLSHDWPEGIYNYGNKQKLLKYKPFFKEDMKRHELGSPLNMNLLINLKPNYWFSAHLHVKFTASVNWENGNQNGDGIKKRANSIDNIEQKKIPKLNKDEISIDLDDFENNLSDQKSQNTEEIKLDIFDDNKLKNSNEIDLSLDEKIVHKKEKSDIVQLVNHEPTKFIALDKCLPRRQYLEILDIPLTDKDHKSALNNENPLYYDEEYISIMKVVEQHKNQLNRLNFNEIAKPSGELVGEFNSEIETFLKQYSLLDDKNFNNLFSIPPGSFVPTADSKETKLRKYTNPQTESFIKKFLV